MDKKADLDKLAAISETKFCVCIKLREPPSLTAKTDTLFQDALQLPCFNPSLIEFDLLTARKGRILTEDRWGNRKSEVGVEEREAKS